MLTARTKQELRDWVESLPDDVRVLRHEHEMLSPFRYVGVRPDEDPQITRDPPQPMNLRVTMELFWEKAP